MGSDLHPEDKTAWLLLIGRRLRAEYDVVSEPVPPRLAALIRQLEDSSPGDSNAGRNHDNGNHENGNHDNGNPGGSNQDNPTANHDKSSARSARLR